MREGPASGTAQAHEALGVWSEGGWGGGPALTLFFPRGPVEEPLSVTAVPLRSGLFELDQNYSLGKRAHYPQHNQCPESLLFMHSCVSDVV